MNGLPMGWLTASRLIRLTLTRDLLRRALLRARPDCSKVSVPVSVSASPKSYRNASRSMPREPSSPSSAPRIDKEWVIERLRENVERAMQAQACHRPSRKPDRLLRL